MDLTPHLGNPTGEVVTSTHMNEQVKGNMLVLSSYACMLYMSVNVNHTSSGNWQTMGWDTEYTDVGGMHAASNSTIQAIVPGVYRVSGQVVFNATTLTIGARIIRNGATVFDNRTEPVNANGTTAFLPPALIPLAANDTLEVAALQSSGGTLAMLGGIGGTSSFFACELVIPT